MKIIIKVKFRNKTKSDIYLGNQHNLLGEIEIIFQTLETLSHLRDQVGMENSPHGHCARGQPHEVTTECRSSRRQVCHVFVLTITFYMFHFP